jgi:hypothetical protein
MAGLYVAGGHRQAAASRQAGKRQAGKQATSRPSCPAPEPQELLEPIEQQPGRQAGIRVSRQAGRQERGRKRRQGMHEQGRQQARRPAGSRQLLVGKLIKTTPKPNPNRQQ